MQKESGLPFMQDRQAQKVYARMIKSKKD